MAMGVTPAWPVAGVTMTVRLAPLPPKAMLPLGTKVVFDDMPDTVRLPAGVSRSLMVKLIAGVGVLRSVLVKERLEITGAVLSGRTVTVKAVLLDLPPVSIT